MIKKLLDATIELGHNLVDAVNNYVFELKNFVFTKDFVDDISFVDDEIIEKTKKKKSSKRKKLK
jgi:hypothetical protein